MENQNIQNEDMWNDFEKSQRRGKIMGGILITMIGVLFLSRELGFQLPVWIFTWKVLLIALGILLAVKHKFLHPGWIVLIAVGGGFLLNDIYPELHIKPILWPSLLILIGLAIVFKPRNKRREQMRRHWGKWHQHKYQHRFGQYPHSDSNFREEPAKEDYIECTSIMAGVKKSVFSKSFKGGEITNVFGGAEINLMQADFEGKINLEITQVFGGTKLLVPANWEIRSAEMVTVFGSLEDKRPVQPQVGDSSAKIVVITGTTVFGGIDIKSY